MKNLSALLLIASMAACSEEADEFYTMESKTTFPGGEFLCYCFETNVKPDYDLGYTQVNESVEYYIRNGRKCEDLGYTEVQSDSNGGSFNGPNDASECGTNGYFVTGS